MRRVSWALLAWAGVGIAGMWASDAASHAMGPGPEFVVHPWPPAWVLFEVWAIGFVLLGAIWNRAPDQPLRRMTWAVLAWTILWIVLFGVWVLDPAQSIVGNGPGAGDLVQLKPPDWALFDCWAIGFVVLGAVWLVVRVRSSGRHHALPT